MTAGPFRVLALAAALCALAACSINAPPPTVAATPAPVVVQPSAPPPPSTVVVQPRTY